MTATILAVLDDENLLGTRYPAVLDGPTGPVAVEAGHRLSPWTPRRPRSCSTPVTALTSARCSTAARRPS